jgi:ribosomal-protein-serine acetyltransferase
VDVVVPLFGDRVCFSQPLRRELTVRCRRCGSGRWTREWASCRLGYGAVVSGRLPGHVVGPGGLVVRGWVREDAAELGEAVADSVEHLRPWMAWVAREPLSVTERQAVLDGWHQEWLAGGDAVMGVFVDGAVAGLCGLHRRIGPGGLEIGYWTARRFLRQGIATTAAGLLIDAAFSDSEITRVEIHHDQANQASVGVPRKLGMRLARKRG